MLLAESYPQIFQVSFEATPFGPSVISWLFVSFFLSVTPFFFLDHTFNWT